MRKNNKRNIQRLLLGRKSQPVLRYTKSAILPPLRYVPAPKSRRSCKCVCICEGSIRKRCARYQRGPEVTDSFFGGGKSEKSSKCDDSKKKEGAPSTAPCAPTPAPAPAASSPKPTGSIRSKLCPPRSSNPFIIFFLTLHHKQPGKPMSCIMREAGKQWCGMSCEEKQVYRRMAKQEQKRRKLREQQRKRRNQRSAMQCRQQKAKRRQKKGAIGKRRCGRKR